VIVEWFSLVDSKDWMSPMQIAEIIAKLDAIQNELLAFDPTMAAATSSGFRETSAPADVRIARAVLWINTLKRDISRETAG
jgi:hypothetical protein